MQLPLLAVLDLALPRFLQCFPYRLRFFANTKVNDFRHIYRQLSLKLPKKHCCRKYFGRIPENGRDSPGYATKPGLSNLCSLKERNVRIKPETERQRLVHLLLFRECTIDLIGERLSRKRGFTVRAVFRRHLSHQCWFWEPAV